MRIDRPLCVWGSAVWNDKPPHVATLQKVYHVQGAGDGAGAKRIKPKRETLFQSEAARAANELRDFIGAIWSQRLAESLLNARTEHTTRLVALDFGYVKEERRK